MRKLILSALLITASTLSFGQAQLKLPALSPGAKITQDFSTSNIEITYSRPSMRGRKIFGDVVPYGKAWRTGANAGTWIKTGEELMIGGQKVKAGNYVIYTIPNKDKWEIVLNTGAGQRDANGYPMQDDIARFTVKPSTMEQVCQTFTIDITDITFTTCKIELQWDRTKVVIPVEARNAESIDVNIDKAINRPAQLPYFQAASYYFETDRKIDLAKTYVDKAVEQDPKAFYIWYLKARIEKKLGNNDAAISAANKSMELAKGTANEDEYLHNNRKLIDEIKRSKPRKQDMD